MGVAPSASPIHPSSSTTATTCSTTVIPAFGTEADLAGPDRRRPRPRHQKVYLGLCAQPHGAGHPWFRDAAASDRNPTATTTSSRRTRRATSPPGGSTRSPRRARPATTAGSGSRPTRGRPEPRALPLRAGLDRPAAPTVTVSETTDAPDAKNTDTSAGGRGPLLRRCADGAFLRHRRYALPSDARLRLRLGIPHPHLDHLVGRRHEVQSPRQPDHHRDGRTLHDDVEQFGRQHPVLAADDVPLALLDGGLRRPQLRKGRRGRDVGSLQDADRRGRQMGGDGRGRIPPRRREAHLPQRLQRREPHLPREVLRPHERLLPRPGRYGRLLHGG